ncbi:MAG: hypothetical protein ACC742_04315 [Thermoanaerobaculales bacterium]
MKRHLEGTGGGATRKLFISAVLCLSAAAGAAQELTPRAYWPAPKGTRVAVLGYMIPIKPRWLQVLELGGRFFGDNDKSSTFGFRILWFRG